MKKYEEEKRKEYIGDGLLTFLLRDILFAPGCDRAAQREIEFHISSNKYLNVVGEKMQLQTVSHPHDNNVSTKAYANAVEALVYSVYTEKGLPAAKEFIEQLVTDYKAKHHAHIRSKQEA